MEVEKCSVPGCTLSFFHLYSLPVTYPALASLWKIACPFLYCLEWDNLKNVRICDGHFRPDQKDVLNRVKFGAVPELYLPPKTLSTGNVSLATTCSWSRRGQDFRPDLKDVLNRLKLVAVPEFYLLPNELAPKNVTPVTNRRQPRRRSLPSNRRKRVAIGQISIIKKSRKRCVLCKNKKIDYKAFWGFPLDIATCRKWLINVGIKDLAQIPIKKLHKKVLCQDHFEPDCIRRRYLLNGKVPTKNLKHPPLDESELGLYHKDKDTREEENGTDLGSIPQVHDRANENDLEPKLQEKAVQPQEKKYLKPKLQEFDFINSLFLSYAGMFRKFCRTLQIMLKLDLARMFARYEMKNTAYLAKLKKNDPTEYRQQRNLAKTSTAKIPFKIVTKKSSDAHARTPSQLKQQTKGTNKDSSNCLNLPTESVSIPAAQATESSSFNISMPNLSDINETNAIDPATDPNIMLPSPLLISNLSKLNKANANVPIIDSSRIKMMTPVTVPITPKISQVKAIDPVIDSSFFKSRTPKHSNLSQTKTGIAIKPARDSSFIKLPILTPTLNLFEPTKANATASAIEPSKIKAWTSIPTPNKTELNTPNVVPHIDSNVSFSCSNNVLTLTPLTPNPSETNKTNTQAAVPVGYLTPVCIANPLETKSNSSVPLIYSSNNKTTPIPVFNLSELIKAPVKYSPKVKVSPKHAPNSSNLNIHTPTHAPYPSEQNKKSVVQSEDSSNLKVMKIVKSAETAEPVIKIYKPKQPLVVDVKNDECDQQLRQVTRIHLK